MKKLWKFFLPLLALLLVATAAVAWKCVSSSKSDAKSELVSDLSSTLKTPSLGDAIPLKATFRTPWMTRPGALSMEPGKGTQIVTPPSLRMKSIAWGSCLYELSAAVQAFRDGDTGEGSIQVSFSKQNGQPDNFTLKIPTFKVSPLKVEPGAKLSIAGKLKEKAPRWPWSLAGALAVLVLALAAWLLWRKFHKKAVPPTAWDIALAAINALRNRLQASPDAAPQCLAELSDILRRYLETRFQLHARTQTSREFLSSLERGDSPLPDTQRKFLKEFLVSADMVKFALASADRRLLEDALLRAEKLVAESIPLDPKGGAR